MRSNNFVPFTTWPLCRFALLFCLPTHHHLVPPQTEPNHRHRLVTHTNTEKPPFRKVSLVELVVVAPLAFQPSLCLQRLIRLPFNIYGFLSVHHRDHVLRLGPSLINHHTENCAASVNPGNVKVRKLEINLLRCNH